MGKSISNRRNFLKTTGILTGIGFIGNSVNALNYSSKKEYKIGLSDEYDLVVCGGGPSGCAAALAAARQGVKVLLVENQGQLGGTGTSGLVSHWLGGRKSNGEWVVGGIFKELAEDAAMNGFALIPQLEGKKFHVHGWLKGLITGIPFDPYGMTYLYDQKVKEAGIDVLFYTHFTDVTVRKNKITHVHFHNKSGACSVATKAVVDATGDADVAFMCNCSYEKGRPEDGMMTPSTLQFHVYNVNQDELEDYITKNNSPRLKEIIEDLREKGIWKFPYDIFISVQLNEKGVMMINTSRLVGFDGTDAKSLSELMMQGRRETYELLDIMQKHIPGFKNARIKSIAAQAGIRETRIIKGIYKLTVDDLLKGKSFDDIVGYSSYGWDLPDPKFPSRQDMREAKIKSPEKTPIPYRIMIPDKISNLICAGRMVSVERQVLGPLRVMAPCMAMGEAAGIASAEVCREGVSFSEIKIGQLQEKLRNNGAIIDLE